MDLQSWGSSQRGVCGETWGHGAGLCQAEDTKASLQAVLLLQFPQSEASTTSLLLSHTMEHSLICWAGCRQPLALPAVQIVYVLMKGSKAVVR